MKPLARLAVVLLAAGTARAESTEGFPRTVWLQPLPIIVAPAVRPPSGPPSAHVSVGMQGALGSSFSLAFELALTGQVSKVVCPQDTPGGCRDGLVAASGSVGPIFHFNQSSRRSGFFVHLKAIAGVMFESGSSASVDSNLGFHEGWSNDFGAGLDFGYQLRWKRLFIAPIVGVTAGRSSRGLSPVNRLFYVLQQPGAGNSPAVYVWPNFNLVRVGGTF